MKTIGKALIGGVIVQVSIFVLLLVCVLINLDKLMPNVGRALGVLAMLTAPGILWLVPEGQRIPNHGTMLALGILIDIILYSVVVYFVLVLRRKAQKQPES